jgi:hypothetical protein
MKLLSRILVFLSFVLMAGFSIHAGTRQEANQSALIKPLPGPEHTCYISPNHRRFDTETPASSDAKKEKDKIFAEETADESEKFSLAKKLSDFVDLSATLFALQSTEQYTCHSRTRINSGQDFSYFSTDGHIALRVIRV